MRSDAYITKKIRSRCRLLLIPAFLSVCNTSFSQHIQNLDSLKRNLEFILPASLYPFLEFYNSSAYLHAKLKPPSSSGDDKTVIFLDSLKRRVSKTLIAKKLYDLLITSREPSSRKTISRSSELGFTGYRGRKIRSIEIQRLNVFGTNLNNPAFYNPNKVENILNRTHFNTNENIIRKNLLFAQGDTISPLILSDNERLLRQLPYIDDARIVVIPVSGNEADIVVLTKDVYSLGANITFSGFDKGSFSIFEKNIFGMGQEFLMEVPYNSFYRDSPGFGFKYLANNIRKTFVDLDVYYFDGLGRKTYGFDLSRKLVSAASRYAGGISIKEMFTTNDLDSMIRPASVKYNLQDYWLSRSFLINSGTVSRIIFGARYTNNNVFNHPFILPDSYHYLQKYKMFLASAAFSVQKYYKTNLIYSYGRSEDVPYGGLINITIGREINEFKKRIYIGTNVSLGGSLENIGYFYSSAGISTFLNNGKTEQGMLQLGTNFISSLSYLGRYRIRNFVNIEYTRGFDRYSDEFLVFIHENGFTGFKNDSIGGAQRLTISLESVFFSPMDFYGFRFAFFGFADLGFLFGTNEVVGSGDFLSGIGLGIRVRNDNLVLNTFQVRLGFYPNLPDFSKVSHLLFSGEQLLRPHNFEPGPPSILPFR